MSKNRLDQETSPYLLQHKDNPVHWWPWGPEALAEAKAQDKPILLSVGYAACHWCHVMAHESFEDQDTADVMNELFINIKVDREERPDIDSIYMKSLHMLGQQGGWPLTMFLTSEAAPFWGGTYFPKEERYGRSPFVKVLREVEKAFRVEKDKIAYNTENILKGLAPQPLDPEQANSDLGDTVIAEAVPHFMKIIDPINGGIQGAPKFPQGTFFNFLWRAGLRYGHEEASHAVENALLHICQGGIYDHLGGGFARYSVDARWLVPHFEKMLYDNAQLVDLLTDVWRESGHPLFAKRVEETIDWLMREMIAEGGGYAASLDADSEGVEGKFYVWSKQEIAECLGDEDAAYYATVYDVRDGGNWEGVNILNRLENLEYPYVLDGESHENRIATLNRKLLRRRDSRIRPGWDDKVLADWNGLMIAAMARAADAFDRPEWFTNAQAAFEFVRTTMTVDRRLRHAARSGKVGSAPATSADYANMIAAALALYHYASDPAYLDQAVAWTETLDKHFWDGDQGGYFFTADDTSDVIVRTKDAMDDAVPNANGTMISNLVALWLLTGENRFIDRAFANLRAFGPDFARNIISHTGLLCGAMDLNTPAHIVLVNETAGDIPLRTALKSVALAGTVVQSVNGQSSISEASPAASKLLDTDQPQGYVCFGPKCAAPVSDVQALVDTIRQERQTWPLD